jgi:hypothetical protein
LNALKALLVGFTCIALAACDDGDSPADPLPSNDSFAAVDAAIRDAYASNPVDGMGLAIYNHDGVKVFERTYGNFSADRRVAIASASKLVSGVVLFRLIDQGYSPGAFGFSPWLDREAGYYAIIGMEIPNSDVGFLAEFRQELKPLIKAALEQL